MEYNLYPTSRDVLHFGKGHDDNPPGRGSGRFAFGSGKRPRQHVIGKPKTKEEILRSGNPKDVLTIQDQLTVSELRDAKDRIELNAKINSYVVKKGNKRWEKVNDIMKHTDDMVKWTSTGIKAWNNFVSMYNSLSSEGQKKPLPHISTNFGGDNKKG